MRSKLVAIGVVFLLNPLSASAMEEKLVTLKTRPGIEQKYLLIKPDKPVASVILFAGGKGALGLYEVAGDVEMNWGEGNFLVRTRDMFAEQGLMVAVVDAPSDQQSKKGMLGGFRNSEEHVTDIDAVIKDLRSRLNIPVWLVGTSRGTESSANIAIHSKQHPDGLVLTSSMSVENAKGTAVTEMALDKVTVPTLLVAHTRDACKKTPPEGAEEIKNMLTNASKVEVKMFSGGDEPLSKPCKAKSYHGFLGIESEVVKYIADFIKKK